MFAFNYPVRPNCKRKNNAEGGGNESQLGEGQFEEGRGGNSVIR